MPFEVQHQVDIPAGKLLRAQLDDLEVKTIPFADKKTGEQKEFQKLKWVFRITEDNEFKDKIVTAETSAFLSDSPDNQFRNWAIALLQRDINQGDVLNEQDLIGLSALITVKLEADYKDPQKKWRRVDDVLSLSPSVGVYLDEPAPF